MCTDIDPPGTALPSAFGHGITGEFLPLWNLHYINCKESQKKHLTN